MMQFSDGRIHHPSTMIICGPRNSAKTTFAQKILEHSQSAFKTSAPAFLVLIYETWQKPNDEMLQRKYINLSIKGLSDVDYLKEIFTKDKKQRWCTFNN